MTEKKKKTLSAISQPLIFWAQNIVQFKLSCCPFGTAEDA